MTNPVDKVKLHTLAFGIGSNAAIANITPLTEMTTAHVLSAEPNVYFEAFDVNVATQKITTASVTAAQDAIDLVFKGTIDTTTISDFITTPLDAATQARPNRGDAHDKLLDLLKRTLTTAQLGVVTTALASQQNSAFIGNVTSLITGSSAPPVANAGKLQSVLTAATVTLDASASSVVTGRTLTCAWTLTSKPAGSAATLATPTAAKATFVADVAGTYVATVIVNDGRTASSADAVTMIAHVVNAAPVANACASQNVVAGRVVTLNGSASSDANNDLLSYVGTLISKPAGSSSVLLSTTSATPTFLPDVPGEYVVSLIVNDGQVLSKPVNVSISVSDACVDTPPGNEALFGYTWSRETRAVKLKNNNECGVITVMATSTLINENSTVAHGVIDNIRVNVAPGEIKDFAAVVPANETSKPSVIYSLQNGKTYKYTPSQTGQILDSTFEILLLDHTETRGGTITEFASMRPDAKTGDTYGACGNFSWSDLSNGKFKIQANVSKVSGECFVGNIQGFDANNNKTFLPAVRHFVTEK